MSPRRTIILIVAVALAGVAAFATYAWLNGVQDRAYAHAKRVQVFVVKKDVPKGTAGEQALSNELVKAGSAPQEFRPATALTDINAIRGKVALTNLSAGQIVVDGMFVDPKVAQVTAAQRIPAGQVAVTVNVDQVRGVAGLLTPGDKVNMLVQGADQKEHFLFQNVNVLFIGSTAAPQPGETQATTAANSSLITFAVPPLAAEKIVLASQGGGIYLTLVPPDNQPVAVPPVDVNSLNTGALTPYE
ncbi:MAG: Flp pilus assembly protein CpaB [Actinobacteria bacterium]|nr:Flp pilus assembly protein CpaB [Actinomycetota bacterium]MBV8959616.1 Flp pilus assembly protein CpaB [Actinomycetota bacterium]MBV9254873.1 Flp pilus assembly protein CpaB [Actinomycetota bacterium]